MTRDGLSLNLTDDGQIKRVVSDGRWLTFGNFGGGLRIRDVHSPNLPQEHEVEQILKDPPVFRSTISSLHLTATVRYIPMKEYIAVDIEVSDKSGRARSLEIAYQLPVGRTGWLWWDSPRQPVKIEKQRSYQVESAPAPVGSEGRLSVYPFAAVAGFSAGIAMAIPPTHPRCVQLKYSDGLMQAVFYFSVSPDSLRSAGKISARILLFNCDPKDGMWDAARRYSGFYPEYFENSGIRRGAALMGLAAGDVDTEENQALGFSPSSLHAYRMTDNLDAESLRRHRDRGIDSFYRLTPVARLKYFGIYPKSPGYVNSLFNILGDAVLRAEIQPYWGQKSGISKVLKDSIFKMSKGWPLVLNFQADQANDGKLQQRELEFLLNVDPDLLDDHEEDAPFTAGQRLLTALNQTREGSPFLAGICVTDAVRASMHLNYNRDHQKYTDLPLTFSSEDKLPVILGEFSLVEFLREVRRRFRSNEGPHRGRRIWLHGDGLEESALYPLVFLADVISFTPSEVTRKAQKPSLDWLRALAADKPIMAVLSPETLKEGDDLPALLRYFTFYGIPLSLGNIWVASSHQEFRLKYGKSIQQYTKLATSLQSAGWRPVTHARASEKGIWLARFGDAEKDTLHFTAFNSAAKDASVELSLDQKSLGLPAVNDLKIVEALSGASLNLKGEANKIKLQLKLATRACAVLKVHKR